MKVFISWSGERSKELANLLRRWLPGVIQAVRPYFSPDDIAKGSRWSTDVAKELSESRVGIICLTPENLEAPWVQFEAGALSKNLDQSRVCPILFELDPADITGPLVQFQSSRFEKGDIERVVRMINEELEDRSLPPSVLESVFEMWWPKLKDEADSILAKSVKSKQAGKRSTRDLLEEILQLTRASNGRPRYPEIHPRIVLSSLSAFRDIIESLDSGLVPDRTYYALKRMHHSLRRLAVSGSPSGRPVRAERILEVLGTKIEEVRMNLAFTPEDSDSNQNESSGSGDEGVRP